MEQIGDSAPFLPSLDVPVPQLVELLDVAVPEQVIEVPKIFVDVIPLQLSVREPQLAADAVPCSRSCAVPFFAGADGYCWSQIFGPTGVYWWSLGSSHNQWTPFPFPPPPLPLHRGLPPGQGGIEILAAATVADVAVVDVPVNMQHKFQQSLFVNPEVLDSVQQQSGGYSSCYTVTGMHSAVVQKTVEIPQLQFLDLVVVPVLCNDKFWYRQCRKTV